MAVRAARAAAGGPEGRNRRLPRRRLRSCDWDDLDWTSQRERPTAPPPPPQPSRLRSVPWRRHRRSLPKSEPFGGPMRRGRGAPRGPLVAPRDRVHACHVRAMLPHSSFAFQWTHWQLALVTGALVSTGAHHHHTHTRFGKIKTHAAQAKQIKFGRAPSVDNGIILFSIFASPRKKNRMRRVTRIQ